MGIVVAVRTYFSIQHIQSADTLAEMSAVIENTYGPIFLSYGTFPPEVSKAMSTHKTCVIGSIFSSVAFLEALINELYGDAFESPNGRVNHLGQKAVGEMAKLWQEKVSGPKLWYVLEKYQQILRLIHKPVFDVKTRPYTDVRLIIQVRNALMHFKPETTTIISQIPETPITIQPLETALSMRFPQNRLTGQVNPFFPDRLLGCGFARWSVRTVLDFADSFFSTIGLDPTYSHVRADLDLK